MNPNLAFARWCSLLALAAVLGACQVTRPPPAANYSLDRAQRSAMLVWEPEIRAPALAVYEQALDRARKQGRLNADSAMAARVRVVAQRVIRASSAFRPDATSWNWEVNLIDSGQLTAWCLPAGKIAVHSGLLTALDLTDDELAAVIAHEIAHALREHASERISELVTSGPGGSAASAGAQPGARDLVALLQRVTFSLPYSAIQESEADRIGVELAARAGYDPQAAISFLRKIVAHKAAPAAQWSIAHPPTDLRVNELKVYAKRVIPLYEQAGKRP